MKTRPITVRLLTALLTLCMLLSLASISVFAADSTVSDETELKAALEDADCTEIKLGGNIETTWELEVNRTVTLDLNGYALSCSSMDENIFRVSRSGNLTVTDSTGGGKIDGQNKNCGFDVKGGTLTLESGSIVNCTDADGDGGAVDVSNTGISEAEIKYGSFTMNGGSILDCKAGDDGAAVDIGRGCSFIMNGGTISGCRAEDDGGAVFIKQGGAFVLNGGTIENCSAGANGGAVKIYRDGHFTMTGGTIKSCKVDLGGLGMAVYGSNDEAVVTMTGGTFEDCGAFPYSFDEFTVTFDSDGGSAVAEQKLRNAPAVKPTDPVKNGYDFAGWYLEEEEYTFTAHVTGNITLKAHWTPNAASMEIPSAAIENVKLDYKHGDVPQPSARRAGVNMDKYDIRYESWEKREKTDEFTTETVSYWYSDESWYQAGEEHLTAFDQDGQYQYSVRLKARDGYTFSDSISADDITINGKSLPEGSDVIVLDKGKSCIVIYGMTLRTVRPLESVTLNGVSTEFYVDGDKPRFNGYSGNAFSDVAYEMWEDKDDRSVGINSDESLNGGYSQLIESFKHGKTYTYGVAFHITDLGLEQGYRFNENTKLYLHGEEVTLKPEQVQVTDGGMTIRFTDVFSMTPEAGGAAPSEKFTITYTDGVDGEEIFPDQSYTAEAGQPTPAFSGTPTRTGYTFAGWDREIPGTMPAENLTIRALWEKVPAPSSSFTDIAPGAYYEKAVAWAVDDGITNGTSDTTFSPNDACNRGQIVTFLWRMAGKPIAQNRNNPFTDVKEGTFCYEAVLWAAEQGITTGKTATTFCPDETCTRGQAITFLWRYAGKPAPKTQNRQFTDVAAGSFCDQAVLWAVENGITNGKSAAIFDPVGKCTRAQAVTFLYRGRDLLKK